MSQVLDVQLTHRKNPIQRRPDTTCAAAGEQLHAVRVYIRNQGFEPDVIKEPSMLAKQRKALLERDQYIEKPKGVDIRLAVRMLEDAYRGLYQECILLTSDVDFIPVIESVQRMGKHVYVFGYRDGMGSDSAFEYVPHKFIDLENRMREYSFTPPTG